METQVRFRRWLHQQPRLVRFLIGWAMMVALCLVLGPLLFGGPVTRYLPAALIGAVVFGAFVAQWRRPERVD